VEDPEAQGTRQLLRINSKPRSDREKKWPKNGLGSIAFNVEYPVWVAKPGGQVTQP
jgi:hypothetical protein